MSMTVQTPHAYRSTGDSVNIFQPFLGLSPEEFRELAGKVLVMITHRPSEGINKGLFRNAGIWGILGTPVATVNDDFEGFVELTRCGTVRRFLEYCADYPNVEYAVFIDNDEEIEWDAPYRLVQWGKDVVSGIICSFSTQKGGVFACVTVKDRYGIARFPSLERTRKLPAAGLREIESAGAGLLCVHRRVFQAMADADEPSFMIPEETRRQCMATGTLKLGEDMAFSQRVKKYGFKMYVDFSVRGKHFKTLEVSWPDKCVDPSLDAAGWSVAEDDFVLT